MQKRIQVEGETGTGTFIKHKAMHDKKGEYVTEEFSTQMVQTQLGVGGGYFKYDPDKVRKSLSNILCAVRKTFVNGS